MSGGTRTGEARETHGPNAPPRTPRRTCASQKTETGSSEGRFSRSIAKVRSCAEALSVMTR